MIEELPDDAALIILCFLNKNDWLNIRLVNKSWAWFELTGHNILWSSLFISVLQSSCYEPIRSNVLEQVVTVGNDREKLLILKRMYKDYQVEQRQKAISVVPPILDCFHHRYFGLDELDRYLARFQSTKVVDERVKVVIVGNTTTGKSCLKARVGLGSFPDEGDGNYHTTALECHEVKSNWNDSTRRIEYWDTATESEYASWRPLSYPQTDVFLMCFSVVNNQSFESICRVWMPEIMQHCPEAIVLLVGTKVDLRATSQSQNSSVYYEEGEFLAKHHKCVLYIETSALTGYNLGVEFHDTIAKCSQLKQVMIRKDKCVIC